MELFVFSEVSKTCETGIKFPRKPTSLVRFDRNKLLPQLDQEYSFQSHLFEQSKLGEFQDGILPCLICGEILNQHFLVPENSNLPQEEIKAAFLLNKIINIVEKRRPFC